MRLSAKWPKNTFYSFWNALIWPHLTHMQTICRENLFSFEHGAPSFSNFLKLLCWKLGGEGKSFGHSEIGEYRHFMDRTQMAKLSSCAHLYCCASHMSTRNVTGKWDLYTYRTWLELYEHGHSTFLGGKLVEPRIQGIWVTAWSITEKSSGLSSHTNPLTMPSLLPQRTNQLSGQLTHEHGLCYLFWQHHVLCTPPRHLFLSYSIAKFIGPIRFNHTNPISFNVPRCTMSHRVYISKLKGTNIIVRYSELYQAIVLTVAALSFTLQLFLPRQCQIGKVIKKILTCEIVKNRHEAYT